MLKGAIRKSAKNHSFRREGLAPWVPGETVDIGKKRREREAMEAKNHAIMAAGRKETFIGPSNFLQYHVASGKLGGLSA